MTQSTNPHRPRHGRRPFRGLCPSRLVAAALALCAPALLLPPPARAYVTSGLPASAHRAYLRRLTDDLCAAAPGTLTTAEVRAAPALMAAWAGAPDKLRLSAGKSARAVEGLLARLNDERRAGNEEAIARTEEYNAVLRSWARSGEGGAAAERVEQILLSMQERYAAGDKDVQPNLESFQIAIEAWVSAADEPNALGRAQQLLDWMTTLHLSSANDLAVPHASCFQPILKGWASSGRMEAPIVAEHLIVRMQRLQMEEGIEAARPDTACFNLVISSWLRSNDLAAERMIRQVFEYMDKCRRLGAEDMQPDATTYNMVLASIAPGARERPDRGGARRADKLLARLEAGCRGGDAALRPDTVAYNTVIDCWAKAQCHRGHYLQARAVLDRQIALHDSGVNMCRPDTRGYTAVVAAGASASGSRAERRRAYTVARTAFLEARAGGAHVRPNAVTYGLLFKAVGRLLPEGHERTRHAKMVFRLCVEDGCLGEMAYRRLRGAAGPELLRTLTGGRGYARLPPEWKARVGESAASREPQTARPKRGTREEGAARPQ